MSVMIFLGVLVLAALGVIVFVLSAQARARRLGTVRPRQDGVGGYEAAVIGDGTHAGHVHVDCSSHVSVSHGGH